MAPPGAGFAALDALAAKWGISVNKSKFQGLWGQGEVEGHKVVPAQASDMNLSGNSIARCEVSSDRPTMSSSCATTSPRFISSHPALRLGRRAQRPQSIIARLGGENFPRIRLGVGAKPQPDYDLAAWVLSKFPPEDVKAMTALRTLKPPLIQTLEVNIMDGEAPFPFSSAGGLSPNIIGVRWKTYRTVNASPVRRSVIKRSDDCGEEFFIEEVCDVRGSTA